jgi:hypothetical protein
LEGHRDEDARGMTTTITYPTGQVFTSSALTPATITPLLQTLTCGLLGINPPDYSKVRVAWQTQGQPFTSLPPDGACYVSCVPEDDAYSRVRDLALSGGDAVSSPPAPVVENWTYTKGWRVTWFFYGPASEDQARAVRSGMFLDYANEQLSLSNLYVVNEPPEVTRLPQEINGEWWEYAEFHVELYEQVTETVQDGVATSVETKLNTKDGQVADFTVSA